jgi:hypothetical protein
MDSNMNLQQTNEADKIHFAVMAIEAAAKKMHISSMEMHRRLVRVGLLRHLLLNYYDVMHTQSLGHVAEDVIEALNNWEARLLKSEEKGETV